MSCTSCRIACWVGAPIVAPSSSPAVSQALRVVARHDGLERCQRLEQEEETVPRIVPDPRGAGLTRRPVTLELSGHVRRLGRAGSAELGYIRVPQPQVFDRAAA